MEYEKIKQLIDDVGNSKLTDIDIEFADGTKIRMKKKFTQGIIDNTEHEKNIIIDKDTNKQEETNSQDKIIKSPMVGTFYIKPSPTAEPYVEIGKNVNKGETLCIIEAMKLMNEIESEYTGKIAEIYIKDGSMVEYGTPLFKII